MTRLIGAGGDHHRGHPRNGNAGLNWGSRQSLPDKTSRPSCQLAIKYAVTADMADGQPLPSVGALKPGQRVRIYYVVDHGARPTEIDVLE